MIMLDFRIGNTYYLSAYNSHTWIVFDRIGAFFFIVMNIVFGNLSAVELFIRERSLFMYLHIRYAFINA